MEDIVPKAILWWIAAVDFPLVIAAAAMLGRARAEIRAEVDALRAAVSAFQVDVARSYAPMTLLKDTESRLVAHLVRIETKLDHTALKAYAGSREGI